MDRKYKRKHANRSAWKTDMKSIKWIAAAATFVIVVVGMIFLVQLKDPITEEGNDTNGVTIGNTYCPIQISEENKGKIRYAEFKGRDVPQIVFYSLLAEPEKELFRIYLGDTDQGDRVGGIQTGDEIVPISVAVAFYEEEDFLDENALLQHYSLMEEVNTVLESIRSTDNFVATDQMNNEKKQTIELADWTIDLPDGITYEEKTEKDSYRADFYGVCNNEKLFLYTVYVGKEQGGTLLGTYTKSGVTQDVGVAPNPLAGQIAAENNAYAVMMDTINDVTKAIMSSEGFAAKVPE